MRPLNRYSVYVASMMAFAVTVMVAFLLYELIAEKELLLAREAAFKEAQTLQRNINTNVKNKISALERMAARWSYRGGIPQEEWRDDVTRYLKDQPGLRAVEWVDKTYHVRWAEPEHGNESAIGLNILFSKQREEALRGAAENIHTTLTPPLNLVQGYKAIISYSPVLKDREFDGFIVGLYSIEDLIASALITMRPDDIVVRLLDGDNVFYETSEVALPNNPELIWHGDLPIYDKKWSMVAYPTLAFIKAHQTIIPGLVFMGGVFMALALALLIHSVQRAQQKNMLVEEKENLLGLFVKHAPAAVAMFDKQMRYIAASDRWYADYGLTGKEIIGKSHYEIFPEIPEAHPQWLELHRRAIEGEVISNDEDCFAREDGTQEWLRYELHPWRNFRGESQGMIMFTEVITERKLMEKIKDEFISTVSHELRTPLTAILGSLDLLLVTTKDKLDEKGQRLMTLAYLNAQRLTRLVNGILDIEKIAAGKMEFDCERREMNHLVHDVTEHNQGYAAQFKVTFEIKTCPGEVFCAVDEDRFHQLLANLLSNAAKFSPEGATVTVSLEKKDAHLLIHVIDRGMGIPTHFHDKIFGKFAQADSSSTRGQEGTGLGLNISKSIVEGMGGSISFVTEEGAGTTFTVCLPLVS